MQMISFKGMKNENWHIGKKEEDALSVDVTLLASE